MYFFENVWRFVINYYKCTKNIVNNKKNMDGVNVE